MLKNLKRGISLLLFVLVFIGLDSFGAAHYSDNQIPYQAYFRSAGTTYGFNWRLLAAQAKQESRFRFDVVSRAKARGVMQILPSTGSEIAKETGRTSFDLFDPFTSIHMGAYYNAKMRSETAKYAKNYKDNLRLMLCAYNAGPHRIHKYKNCPPFKETQQYYRVIFQNWEHYKQEYLP